MASYRSRTEASVSASGYTRPSIRKAMYHGVDLYELRAWEPADDQDFEHIPAQNVLGHYCWKELSQFKIRGSRGVADHLLQSDPLVAFSFGPTPIKFNEWLRQTADVCRDLAHKDGGPSVGEGVQLLSCSGKLVPANRPFICVDGENVYFEEIAFSEVLERREEKLPCERKVLVKLGEGKPIAGCCVSSAGSHGLLGLTISGKRVELVMLPVSLRNQRKIYKHKL